MAGVGSSGRGHDGFTYRAVVICVNESRQRQLCGDPGHDREEELLTPSPRPFVDRLVGWVEILVIAASVLINLTGDGHEWALVFLLVGGVPHLLLGSAWRRTWWWWPLAGVVAHGILAPVLLFLALITLTDDRATLLNAIGVLTLAMLPFGSALVGIIAQLALRLLGIPTRHLVRHLIGTVAVAAPFVAVWWLW